MSDTPFIIGANGMIANVNWNPSGPQNAFAGISPGKNPNGTPAVSINPGPGPWAVSQLLPGASIQVFGASAYDLPSGARSPQLAIGQGSQVFVSGTRGGMQVDFTAGVGASDMGLAFLVGATDAQAIGIQLIATNEPSFFVSDVNGVTVLTQTSLTSLVAGSVNTLKLFWDSGTGVISLFINGVQFPTTLVPPWHPFVPTILYTGNAVPAGVGAVTNSFDGTVGLSQVSPLP
jgi:hypothetical protein